MERYSRRTLLQYTVGLTVLGASLGEVRQAHAAGGALATLRANKVVRVGFANENPYGYTTADGKLTGTSVEVIRYIMGQLGVPVVNGILTQFSGLIPGLQANRFDIIGAGLYIRPDRCTQASPGDPDLANLEALFVRKGNPHNLHSLKDIAKNPAVKVATTAGSAEDEYLTIAGIQTSQKVYLPSNVEGFAALRQGRTDALFGPDISLMHLVGITTDPTIERVDPFTQPVDKNGKPAVGYSATYFRKGDNDLREAYNVQLAKINSSGKLLHIIAPFGVTRPDIPPLGLTAASLCKT